MSASESAKRYCIRMLDRRRFLQVLVALGAARAVPLHAQASFPFSLGVASGYPTPSGVVLWTRLTGFLAPVAVAVRWEIAQDEAMRQVVASGSTEASPEWAHSVHVEANGLEPARRYFYRFTAAGAQGLRVPTRTP